MKVHFSLPDSSVDYDRDGVVSFLLLRGSQVVLSWQFSPRSIFSITSAYISLRSYLVNYLMGIEPLYSTEWELYVPWPVSCSIYYESGERGPSEVLFLDPFDLPEVM